ncbi:MAG TPA: hypothetical protein VIH57_06205 [Bacteroidales bacterium]
MLKVKFNINSEEEATEVQIENSLDKKVDAKGLKNLEDICTDIRIRDFVDFYSKYNGFSLGTPIFPKNTIKKTLLTQLAVSDLIGFTKQYLPNGEWAWTIDLNKVKSLYRSENKWLAFANVNGGPTCLTIFLDGENAGKIFLLNPQPHFNILRPIAKTYNELLDRIAKDPAAFFKLVRAYLTIIGKDKLNYGYVPIEYIDNK